VMPRIFMALRSGEPTKLRQIMEATPSIPDSCQWCIFLRNHDELTLEMVTEEEREWMWQEYAPDPRMRLNLGIRRRLAPLLDNDQEKILLANRVLLSLPGAPIIYYGDEIGMGDNIWLPDRNGVRTPMQWTSDPGAGFSAAPSTQFYAPVVDNPDFGPHRVNVTDQEADPDSLLNAMRALIALRKQHPVLARGDLSFLDVAETSLLAFVRRGAGETVIVVHNFGEHPVETVLPLPDFVGCQPTDLLTGRSFHPVEQAGYPLRVGRRESLWLSVVDC
jgi:maltose alpha-D-glucosyltransferase/alpha-amylase